jgi:hypothetical protein
MYATLSYNPRVYIYTPRHTFIPLSLLSQRRSDYLNPLSPTSCMERLALRHLRPLSTKFPGPQHYESSAEN